MRVMISCGEPSGDMYAGALVREILRRDPSAVVTGFGGDRLRDSGATLVEHFSGLSVTGLLEVARVLPRTYATYRRLVRSAAETRPDVFVAIDFPDFNFRLALALKRLGIPVVYYVGPQLWAWRPGRLQTMKRIADKVLVIFPFEEEVYRTAGVPVDWVGHPLLDLAPPTSGRDAFLKAAGLDPARPVVALLPGSRRNEVKAVLPGLVDAAGLIRARLPRTQFLVGRAPHLDNGLFAPLESLANDGASVPAIEGATDGVLAAADLALVASGTVTVQAALHECPMVVVYRLSPVTYRLGRPFVHVDTFAMANLVAGRQVVPELIQEDFTADNVARHALQLLTEPSVRARMRADLREVRQRLGEPGASRRAAAAVLDVAAAGRSRGLE